MNKLFINPSVTFYNKNKKAILNNRESLFQELKDVSDDFAVEARNILNDKLNSNQGRPLLGELFPWIIKDLIDADKGSTEKVSVGWLAIYLYTLFLDEYVDNPKPLSSNKFITGSLLAKTGLLKISRLTNNTEYESYLDKALSFAALNQSRDVKNQKNISNTKTKEEYSKNKNYVLLSCVGALAAQNSKHEDFITEFSESLLLTLQYLDDISDFHEDYKLGNMTVILNEAFKEDVKFKQDVENVTSRELLEKLIVTRALEKVIGKIQTLLNQSIFIIKKYDFDDINNSSSTELFYTLQYNLSSLNKLLVGDAIHYKEFSIEKRNIILDKVEKHISIVAQST